MFLNFQRDQPSYPTTVRPAFKWVHAAFFAGLMIAVWVLEVIFETSFSLYGLRPRNPIGLWKIVVFPFLHGDWKHLISNLLPFSILSILVFNMYPKHGWKIYILTFGLSGFWTWCFARPGIVVGASGWVYALLGFLLWTGFSKASHKAMAVAGGLAFLYGGFVMGLVPVDPRISWEGHFMGLMAGFTAAVYWRHELTQPVQVSSPKRPIFEKDPPYPYWLFDMPHVLDQFGDVIPPEKLEWIDGKPKLKIVESEIDTEPVKETGNTQAKISFSAPIPFTYSYVSKKNSDTTGL